MCYFLRKIKSHIPPIIYRVVIWIIIHLIVEPFGYILSLFAFWGMIKLLDILNAPPSVYFYLFLVVVVAYSCLKFKQISVLTVKNFRKYREMQRNLTRMREQREREKYW